MPFDGTMWYRSDPVSQANRMEILRTWAAEASGEMCWYAGKTSSILSPWKSQRAVFLQHSHIYPLQNMHKGQSPPPLQTSSLEEEIKLRRADRWHQQRARTPKRCDLALQVLVSHFVLKPLGLQFSSLSASPPLKGAFKSLPAAMDSFNDLFIC